MRYGFLFSVLLILLLGIIFLNEFFKSKTVIENVPMKESVKTILLTSPSFQNNSVIPAKFTCKGENINPELKISDIPAETKSLVLVMDDPDAPSGDWVHWLKWNIPSETEAIVEGVEPVGVSGKGSGGNLIYKGPCPPSGTHRYFFKIYALDTELSLTEGSNKASLLKVMAGHIIGQGELVGLFSSKN